MTAPLVGIPEADLAEQVVVSYLLGWSQDCPTLLDEMLAEGIHEGLFRQRPARLAWRAAVALGAEKAPITTPTVGKRLLDGPESRESASGDLAALAGWAQDIPPRASNWRWYADQMAQAASMRDWQLRAGRIVEAISSGDGRDEVQGLITALAVDATKSKRSLAVRTSHDLMAAALDDWESKAKAREEGRELVSNGFATGIPTVDRTTGGLVPGDLFVLAGRTRAGKSTLGCQIAYEAALKGAKVLILELEMRGLDVVKRVLAANARTSLTDAENGLMRTMDWQRIEGSYRKLVGADVRLVDQTGALTMRQITTFLRSERVRAPYDLVVVDHFHRIALAGKSETARIEFSTNIREFKNLASELQCCMLVLAQLNREAEGRGTDKTPRTPSLTDLQETGALEQEADVVALLHRPYEQTLKQEDANKATLALAKVRHGRSVKIDLFYNDKCLHFGEAEKQHADQPTF